MKNLFIFIGLMFFFLASCVPQKQTRQVHAYAEFIEKKTHEIVFDATGLRLDLRKDTQPRYIYPIFRYFKCVEPIYYDIGGLNLDSTYKTQAIPVRIPGNMQHIYDYFPNTSSDSVLFTNKSVRLCSPLMPTKTKGEYVMQSIGIGPTGYPQERLYVINLNFYRLSDTTFTFLRGEEFEMGVLNLDHDIEQKKREQRYLFRKHVNCDGQ